MLYNPNNRNVEIYVNSGQLSEKYWNAGNGQWIGWQYLGGNLSSNPSVFYNPSNHNVEIYVSTGGQLSEKYWNAANGQWIGWNILW